MHHGVVVTSIREIGNLGVGVSHARALSRVVHVGDMLTVVFFQFWCSFE